MLFRARRYAPNGGVEVMPPRRGNPADYVAMVRHEALEELEVSGVGFLGLAEHDVTYADCYFERISPVVMLQVADTFDCSAVIGYSSMRS